MKNRIKPNAELMAHAFGCSVDQAKAHFKRNAEELSRMADKAAKTGRKVNNYTEAELRAMSDGFLSASL